MLLCGNLIEKTEDGSNIVRGKRFQLYYDNIIKREHIKQDIYTEGNCHILSIDWKSIFGLIAPDLKDIPIEQSVEFINQLSYMKKIDMFKNSSDNTLHKICIQMKIERFNQGDTIFSSGDKGDKYYLIKEGKVGLLLKSAKEEYKVIDQGNYFGERALLEDKPRSGTIKALTNVVCYVLHKKDFIEAIDSNMLNYLNHRMALQDNFKTKLEDFYWIKDLGKGKFGNVSLVHNNKYL